MQWRSLDDTEPGELTYHLSCFSGPMTLRLADLMAGLVVVWDAMQRDPARVYEANLQMDDFCEFFWPLPPDARTVLVTQAQRMLHGPRCSHAVVGAERHYVH